MFIIKKFTSCKYKPLLVISRSQCQLYRANTVRKNHISIKHIKTHTQKYIIYKAMKVYIVYINH